MKNNLLSFILLLCSLQVFSQNIEIQGVVADSLDEPIIAASIMLTSKADSVLAGFALTDNKGAYSITNLNAGEYLIQITYMGYKSHVEYVEIKDADETKIIEKIILQSGNTMLEEVLVMEDRIPILIKKDTIEYNAGSFETRPNAVVQDLLKELPGIEIEEDGTIKAQGKEVTKLLVDGEEFFGDDPTVATKNLPAKAVDKVQVYDEQTEEQKLSGLTMGEKEKTINLKLKEDYKKGYFGKAMAGGGTSKRFAGEFNLNRFDKKNQASLISKFNNINNSGFSIQEYADFMGGFQNMINSESINSGGSFTLNSSIPINNGNTATNGNKTTGILGLNYAKNITEKIKINSYYTFNVVDDKLITNSLRNNFISPESTFNTEEEKRNTSRYYNNNASVKLSFNIDTTQRIKWDNKLTYSLGKQKNNKFYENSNTARLVTDNGGNQFDAENSSWGLDSKFTYRKRFKPGRTLSTVSNFKYNNSERNNRTEFNNLYYDEDGFVVSEDSLDRIENNISSKINVSQKITYVEPIGKFTRWSNSYLFSYKLNNINNETEDLESGIYMAVNDLSRNFGFATREQKISTRIEYSKGKYSFSLGSDIQNKTLLIDEVETRLFEKPYWFVLPNSRIKYKINKNSNVSINYRTNTRIPSFSQLQPTTNNSDPLHIYIGNPNLDPEYSHRISMNYNMFNNFNFNNLFLNASYSITPNAIVSKSEYDELFVETTQSINDGRKTSTTVGLTYSTPLKFIKSRLKLRLNTRFSQQPFFVNDINALREQFSQSLSTTITNKKKKNIDIKLVYDISYNKSSSSDASQSDVVYINHRISPSLNFQLPKGWSIGTAANYKLYNSSSFSDNIQIILWDAFIEKTLFKNKKGSLRLIAVDLLNQNRGINRSANTFYTLEERTNAIGRFGLLTFSYNLSFFSNKDKK